MWCHLKNLAGVKDPDETVKHELMRAKIDIIKGPLQKGEVATTITGRMAGNFIFTRAWTYWVVKGLIPLDLAVKLYADPAGRDDIRVDGHCGCPPPEDPWLVWLDDEGNVMVDEKEKKDFDHFEKTMSTFKTPEHYRFVKERRLYKAYVDLYHIDSEIGLRIFADQLRTLSFELMSRLGDFSKKAVFKE